MTSIFGTRSENLKTAMEEYMRSAGPVAAPPAVAVPAARGAPTVVRVEPTAEDRVRAAAFVGALGGAPNIKRLEPVAMTRLRVEERDNARIDERALQAAGASGALRVSDTVVHVVVGSGAERLGVALEETLAVGSTAAR